MNWSFHFGLPPNVDPESAYRHFDTIEVVFNLWLENLYVAPGANARAPLQGDRRAMGIATACQARFADHRMADPEIRGSEDPRMISGWGVSRKKVFVPLGVSLLFPTSL
jgi:hypothetical protein